MGNSGEKFNLDFILSVESRRDSLMKDSMPGESFSLAWESGTQGGRGRFAISAS